jgi:hypothetical protein
MSNWRSSQAAVIKAQHHRLRLQSCRQSTKTSLSLRLPKAFSAVNVALNSRGLPRYCSRQQCVNCHRSMVVAVVADDAAVEAAG